MIYSQSGRRTQCAVRKRKKKKACKIAPKKSAKGKPRYSEGPLYMYKKITNKGSSHIKRASTTLGCKRQVFKNDDEVCQAAQKKDTLNESE